MDTEQDDKKEKEKKVTREGLRVGFNVLLRYTRQHRITIIILSVIGILSAIGNGLMPYISGRFFDSIINTGSVDIFGYSVPLYVGLLILWCIVQSITYVIDWRISILSQYVSNTIWLDYIAQGFAYLLNLPVSFHKKNKIGQVGNDINRAANSLESIISNVIIDLAPQILSIVIAFVIVFIVNKVLAAILVIGLLIYIVILLINVKPLAGLQKVYNKHLSRVWGDSYDAMVNSIAIKQATSEEYEGKKMAKDFMEAVPMWMKQTIVWGNLSLYQRITILITQIVIFIISIGYIHAGTMTLGELLAFNGYAAMVFGPFIVIARNWQTIQNGIIQIQESEKVLSLPIEIYEPINAPAIDIRGDIDFKNVSFQYDEGKPVLQDISFSIKAGEIIALVGESGVGKSTLIDLISAYHFANNGDVFIDGHDVKTLNLRKLRKAIAVVPQEVVLFNDTIETNIKYGNFEATHEEIKEASRKAHALDFIQKFPEQWKQLVGERGIKLSVGQKQRIAIARAILRNPKILVLDEPTSALDAGTEKIITESLDKLMTGKTTFIIAHRLSTVRKAHKILVFKEGKIIESGKHDELLKIDGGEYRRLYELQIGLHA
ncbi:MAG TPA: ABC transporter ATP-binding protein [Candidatus Paceibacterota bacterium]|jgi:subfamily B ATP-binding cassette protein MsbA|nr:ABC transporter ATP-binding protein [Candidatus Paceibacterota bacterium]